MNQLAGPVAAALRVLGVDHEVLPCDPALADTEAFCAHYGIPRANSGNAIVVASRREPKIYAACLVTAVFKLDVNKRVRGLLKASKLSFASAEETAALTGMEIGGVTLFGLPGDLPIYIDASIMSLDFVILGGGNRSSKVKLDPVDLLRIPGAESVDGLGI